MARTLLQIVQAACGRIGIPSPNAVISSTDPQISQLLALANEHGADLALMPTWQALAVEVTFTTVATQVQASLATLAPDFNFIINDTIWNRTLRRPVYGPNAPTDWAQAKASQLAGPFSRFRIIQNAINFYPIPSAGQTCAFEYQSNAFVSTATGGTSAVWTNDNDTPRLDDELFVLGLLWRWKQAKGLGWEDDFQKHEKRLTVLLGNDGGAPRLNMSGAQYDIQPVVLVPVGSWMQ